MQIIQPIAIDPGGPLLEFGSLSLDFLTGEYAVADPIGNPTALFDSNVPEDDAPVWAAGSFDEGDRVLFDHSVYEALTTTSAQPDVGAAADPPTWLRVSAANRWKMFDRIISAQTEQLGSIAVSILPGTPVNALALFGLYGSDLLVTMTDPAAGVVYNEARSLQDNTAIVDWYAYFFEDIIQISDLVLLDLPTYRNAVIDVSIFAGAENAKCGELVLGKQREIGAANYGTSVGIQSYSKKDVDDFGNVSITKRAFSKLADFDITIETTKVDSIQELLAAVRDIPIVYIGDPDRRSTIIFGFFRSFSIVLENVTTSDCSIEVEGLT